MVNAMAFGPAPRPLCGRFFLKSQDRGPRATTLLGSQVAGSSCAGSGVGCAPAPLPLPQIPPELLILLTQRHTLSSRSLQGHIELEARPAALPPASLLGHSLHPGAPSPSAPSPSLPLSPSFIPSTRNRPHHPMPGASRFF